MYAAEDSKEQTLQRIEARTRLKGLAEVAFDHHSRVYPGNDKPSVDDLNLDIEDGELLSSSALLAVSLRPFVCCRLGRGSVAAMSLTMRDRDIAMVFQNYALYPQYRCRQHGLRPEDRRRTRDPRREGRRSSTPIPDRKPKALVGGQRQRVAMGRATSVSRRSSWRCCPT